MIRFHVAFTIAVLGCSALSGCDSCFYAEGERAAEARFRTISVGETEEQVVSALGAPAAEITRGSDGGLTVDLRRESGVQRQALKTDQRGSWPEEVRFLPSHEITSKVLVYVEGTVLVYYFIDVGGRVEFVDVFVS
jgi:hypothetical protein